MTIATAITSVIGHNAVVIHHADAVAVTSE